VREEGQGEGTEENDREPDHDQWTRRVAVEEEREGGREHRQAAGGGNQAEAARDDGAGFSSDSRVEHLAGKALGAHGGPLPAQPSAIASAALAVAQTPIEAAQRERRVVARSEEHTSELQSPYDLVCRL